MIKPVLLVSGALTCTMFLALVAPQTALRATFGETLDGPVADMVVRNWGALIGLVVSHGAPYIQRAAVPLVADTLMIVAFAAYLLRPRGTP